MAYAWNRLTLSFAAFLVLAGILAGEAAADKSVVGALKASNDAISMAGLSAGQLRDLGANIKGAVGAPALGPWTQVAATTYCNGSRPGGVDADVSCTSEWLVCNPAGVAAADPLGPAVNVWTRLVNEAGQPVDGANQVIAGDGWRLVGFTCLPNLVPGAAAALTMADIVRQFHDTKFAVPQVSVQPVGGTTLVNLPTYFELVWPTQGFAPGGVDTTTLVGHQVRIRPTLVGAEYFFGDGASSGATLSLGGPYPTGDIVHTYSTSGSVQVRVDVTYGGQFSVDGGEWIEVPGTAVVTGTAFPLRVAEARARLYSN